MARNEYDTLFAGTINTTAPGNYIFTLYTDLISDTIINSNDTTYTSISIKTPVSVPHAEIFNDLGGDLGGGMGDWKDRNWSSYPYYDRDDNNYFMRAWLNQWSSMFLFFDKKIENTTSKTNLLFDYRFFDEEQEWPLTDSLVLNPNEKLHIIISSACGVNFDTIYSINALNHINTSDFTTLELSLSEYAGYDIIVGFTTEWDTIMAIVDIDNVIIVDNIDNNVIFDNQAVCEDIAPDPLIGAITTGGIGPYNYLWQESYDEITWTEAHNTNMLQTYAPDLLFDTTYYRRIVNDTLIYADTSNIISIIRKLNPAVNIIGDTTACESTILDESSGIISNTYLWSNSDTTQTSVVSNSGTYWLLVTDENGCSNSDTVEIIIYSLPVVSLGQDTTINSSNSIILEAGEGFDYYLWSTGETTSTITVDSLGTGISTAIITVLVSDTNACENSDTITITFDNFVKLLEYDEEIINIYPNPSSGIFNITAKNLLYLEVIDTRGSVVYQNNMVYNQAVVDLSAYPKGLYFVKIVRAKETLIKKIIKE